MGVVKRFWEHVDKTDGCWNWTGAKTSAGGYGNFRIGEHTKRANRVSWEIHNGVIPQGMLVCHACDNPSCVNPDHLFLGTHKDNTDDMLNKNREKVSRPGMENGKAKLTKEQVLKMRADYTEGSAKELAKEYGVISEQVYKIIHRRQWKHI